MAYTAETGKKSKDWTSWPEAPASTLPTASSQLEGVLFPSYAAQQAQASPAAKKQAERFRDMLARRRAMILGSASPPMPE